MLLLLERHELTVSELCTVMQLPQSTVSRHLKTLADGGWVVSRRDGTSRYYTLSLDDRGVHARRLWTLLRDQVGGTPGADQDARRLKNVLVQAIENRSIRIVAIVHVHQDQIGRPFFLLDCLNKPIPRIILCEIADPRKKDDERAGSVWPGTLIALHHDGTGSGQ